LGVSNDGKLNVGGLLNQKSYLVKDVEGLYQGQYNQYQLSQTNNSSGLKKQ